MISISISRFDTIFYFNFKIQDQFLFWFQDKRIFSKDKGFTTLQITHLRHTQKTIFVSRQSLDAEVDDNKKGILACSATRKNFRGKNFYATRKNFKEKILVAEPSAYLILPSYIILNNLT